MDRIKLWQYLTKEAKKMQRVQQVLIIKHTPCTQSLQDAMRDFL